MFVHEETDVSSCVDITHFTFNCTILFSKIVTDNRFLSFSSQGKPRDLKLFVFAPDLKEVDLVGLGRLELPTPRLSSVCSNQLSYRPILNGAFGLILRQSF